MSFTLSARLLALLRLLSHGHRPAPRRARPGLEELSSHLRADIGAQRDDTTLMDRAGRNRPF